MFNIYTDFFGVDVKVRYRFPIKKESKVLVLTPHPDDETIGCAGTISFLQQQGIDGVVVLFTRSEDTNENEIDSNIRLEEFTCTMGQLNCHNVITLDFPDGKLKSYYEQAKEQLKQIIMNIKPDIIFTPYLMDYHPDHRCVSQMLAEVITDKDVFIAMYEVWVPILYPNFYIDISEFWDRKLAALNCYGSQIEQYSIKKKAENLNQMRASLSMRKRVKYIEAYKGFYAEKYIQIVQMLRTQEIL